MTMVQEENLARRSSGRNRVLERCSIIRAAVALSSSSACAYEVADCDGFVLRLRFRVEVIAI
jgi:hypothetical protein